MIFHRPAARATYPHNRSPQIQPSRSTVSGGWHDPREQWCLAAGLLRTHRAPLAAFQDDDLYAKSVGEEFSGNLWKELLNMAIDIVDLPIKIFQMVIFHSFVNVYQKV